ncbi:FH1/FH2 domain-containing protein 3, partial [Stegodyphus mimosarum]
MNTVCAVDSDKGTTPWSNIMNLLKEKDSADMELLVYAVTLINKTLNGIPDQDTYYDIVDNLEEQGMENVIQYYMSKQGTDLDLLQQFQIYEAVLKHEDGVPDTKPLPLDARFRQVPRRKSQCDESDRRKSRRHSVGTINSTTKPNKFHSRSLENTPEESPFTWQDRNQNHIGDTGKKVNKQINGHVNGNGINESCHDINGITPALRKRRERDARNKSLIKEQEENSRGANYQRSDSLSSSSSVFSDSNETSPLVTEDKSYLSIVERHRSRFENHVDHENRKNSELSKPKDDKALNEERKKLCDSSRPNSLPYGLSSNNKKSWMLSMMYGKSQDEEIKSPSAETVSNGVEIVNNNYIVYNKREDESLNSSLSSVKKDNSFKDMQEKFIYRNGDSSVRSPTSDNIPRIGDPSGIISRAKEGLAASKSIRPDSKPTSPLSPSSSFIQEMKKPETDLQWEQLIKSVKRPLIINDLDFTDLRSDEDVDLLESLGPEITSEMNGGPPPPPLPPGLGPPPPPPPLPLGCGPVPPPPPPQTAPPNKCGSRLNGIETPSVPPTWLKRNQHHSQEAQVKDLSKSNQKTKKTVKLFWREVKEDKSLLKKIGRKKTIWDELTPVPVDTQKLEHLFENRAKDVMNKKSQDCVKKSEIIVLDTKRSNAINIGMTKLPPPRTIKTAILKMDSTIMNREGIEKILTMLPTEDEKSRIAEAQMNNPDVPLGTAEQFLLTLSSISELEARLRLWAFRLDYETMEREVAEPLMDLKQAMKEIESSETFRVILSTLRSVGNFLNGVEIKGFHIEYLSKVPEVKDTVQKHSLLHHLCHIVMEKFPKSCDLYSEIGSVTR